MLRLLVGVLGVLVVLGTTSSVVRTLVVPRAVHSKLTRIVTAATLAPFNAVADRSTSVEARDRVRAWGGPLSLVTALLAWLLCYLLGYGLLVAATTALPPTAALREAGSSLFTLGFASTDRSAHRRGLHGRGDRSAGHRPAGGLPAHAVRRVQPP